MSKSLTSVAASILLFTASFGIAQKNPPKSGKATTTRYWDCSGGSCGCAYLPYGKPSEPAHCRSNALFDAPPGNKYGAKFYGSAAVSDALGGGYWLGEACGKCWKVTGTSNVHGMRKQRAVTTTLILKGTNFCPPEAQHCNGVPHFDIAAPGFDVLAYSLSNTCADREPGEIEGFKSCGSWRIKSSNPKKNCDCCKFRHPVLRQGCENFLSLGWDNPEVDYEEVDCPSELSRLPCWEHNGDDYPRGIPELCADPTADGHAHN